MQKTNAYEVKASYFKVQQPDPNRRGQVLTNQTKQGDFNVKLTYSFIIKVYLRMSRITAWRRVLNLYTVKYLRCDVRYLRSRTYYKKYILHKFKSDFKYDLGITQSLPSVANSPLAVHKYLLTFECLLCNISS